MDKNILHVNTNNTPINKPISITAVLSIIISLSASLSFSGCSNEKHPNKEAIKLNDTAILINGTYPDSAIALLEEAILLDPNNYLYYNNKATIHLKQGEYIDAVYSLHCAIKVNPGSAETVMFLAMLYDCLEYEKEARICYLHALKIFDDRIKMPDHNLQANRLNRTVLLFFLKDPRSELEKEKYFNDYPDDQGNEIFNEIKGEDYLKQLCAGSD